MAMNTQIFRRILIALALAGLAFPVAANAQGSDQTEVLSALSGVIRWSGVVTSIFVLIGAWMLLRVQSSFIDRMSRQFAAKRLILQKFATISQFVIYVGTGIAVLLLSLRIDETVLAIIGGTVAVSVGFAIKDLVASFIAGIIIMLDRPFQVGDRVSFGGEYGDIITIGLRSVQMNTLDDNIVTIPNNKFLSDITSSGNYGELDMQVVMDFYIAPDQDIDQAITIVNEAALTSRYVHLPKPIVVLVKQTIEQNYVAIQLRLKAYVLDTQYEKLFETDIHLRVLRAFRAHDIQAPAVLHRDSPIKTR